MASLEMEVVEAPDDSTPPDGQGDSSTVKEPEDSMDTQEAPTEAVAEETSDPKPGAPTAVEKDKAADDNAPAPIEAEEEEKQEDDSKKAEDSIATGAVPEPIASPTTNEEEESRSAENAAVAFKKCILCDTVMTRGDRPMLLECLHSACASCIESKLQELPDQEIVDSNAILCPWCSIASAYNNLIVDRLVLERCTPPAGEEAAADGEGGEMCVSCEEGVPASSFCEDCSELLCDACVQAHRRVRVTKDHSIVEKSQATKQRQRGSVQQEFGEDLRCSTHPAETLTLFCEKCDRLTCRDCQLSEHREHRYKFINEIAAEAKRSLTALLAEVSYKRGLLESAVKVIDKRQTAINEKKQQVVQEITRLVILLTNAINGRGKQLVQRLGEVCDNKQRTLQEKRATLQQLTRLTDHCISSVSTQLESGSDLALLWSKKTIMRHLQRIKSRRADIPNPDIPVRIHFAQQRVDTLCNALATVGGIVVDGRAYPSTEVPERVVRSPSLPPQGLVPQQHQPLPQQQQQPPQQHQAPILVHHRPNPQQLQQHSANVTIRPGNSHQVSSSTHPGVHQLRTLLSPAGPAMLKMRGSPALPGLRPLQPSATLTSGQLQAPPQLQLQGTLQVQGVRLPMHRPPPPLTPATNVSSMASSRAPVWHIPPDRPPQLIGQPGVAMPSPAMSTPNDNFRITLTNQWLPPTEQVSSSANQRSTPSPATKGAAHDSAALHLDSFCQKSMDDLFSVIADLNQDGRPARPAGEKSVSPLVDSSTGSPSQTQNLQTPNQSRDPLSGASNSPVKDDPNEDWCAVCMDGGDLVCCDRCPKVFHTHCHIPQLGSIEETPDSWQCLLCTPISQILQTTVPPCEEGAQGLNPRQLRLAQRILLELYCQYDHSQPFRDPVSLELFPEYQRVVEHPMSLDVIKRRLETNRPDSYKDLQLFINDIRLIFKNAYAFNPKDTAVYGEARALEDIFENMVGKWLPGYITGRVSQREEGEGHNELSGGSAKRFKRIRLE